MKPVQIDPVENPLPPRRFEIRRDGAAGELLGTIEADNHLTAAQYACRSIFARGTDVERFTGWGGASGVFRTVDERPVFFWVGDPAVKVNPPPPAPEPAEVAAPKKANAAGKKRGAK